MAPGLRFGDDALHHLIRQRAPELHFDAVLLLERGGERPRFRGRERGVEDDATLAPRALKEPRLAVGAAIKEDVVAFRGSLRQDGWHEQETQQTLRELEHG